MAKERKAVRQLRDYTKQHAKRQKNGYSLDLRLYIREDGELQNLCFLGEGGKIVNEAPIILGNDVENLHWALGFIVEMGQALVAVRGR